MRKADVAKELSNLESWANVGVETFLREDVGEKWQFRALFMAAALAFVLYGIPAIVRACQ